MSSAPLGKLIPGVLATGVQGPQALYKGDGFTPATFYCRVSVAPRGAALTVLLYKNGATTGTTCTVADGAQTGSVAYTTAVADGAYFSVNITQVGTAPNEGSDLVWMVAP